MIAVQVAHQLENYFGEFVCTNIELDDDNYKNLESVLSRHQYAKIEVVNIHGAFADVVGRILSGLGAKLAPSFFFIDPFGFGGVPFATIKEILSIPRTEVFITFMYRDVNRFFETPAAQAALHELFGTEVSEQLNRVSESREHSLRDLYVKQLRDVAKVKYVWPFRVSMAEERRTLYYLIHATNHFKGLMLMKTVMYNEGIGGDFCYLGPEDGARRIQPSFFDDDVRPLRDLLLQRFKGMSLTYNEIEELTWEAPFIDKHYRAVLKALAEEGAISIRRVSSKRTGLKDKDEILFPN
jgi:three-Cys-motif partner protein